MDKLIVDQRALVVGYDDVAEFMAYGQYRAAVVAYEKAKQSNKDTETIEHKCDRCGRIITVTHRSDQPTMVIDCGCRTQNSLACTTCGKPGLLEQRGSGIYHNHCPTKTPVDQDK